MKSADGDRTPCLSTNVSSRTIADHVRGTLAPGNLTLSLHTLRSLVSKPKKCGDSEGGDLKYPADYRRCLAADSADRPPVRIELTLRSVYKRLSPQRRFVSPLLNIFHILAGRAPLCSFFSFRFPLLSCSTTIYSSQDAFFASFILDLGYLMFLRCSCDPKPLGPKLI